MLKRRDADTLPLLRSVPYKMHRLDGYDNRKFSGRDVWANSADPDQTGAV